MVTGERPHSSLSPIFISKKMKTIIRKTLTLIIMAVLCLQASAQIEFLSKYAKNDKVKVMTMGKEMIALIGDDMPSIGDMDLDDIGSLINKVDNINLVNVTDQKTIAKVLKDVNKTVKKNKFSTVLSGKDDDIDIGIYFLQKAGKSHLLLSGNEGKELNLIILDGSFSLADLGNLTNLSSDNSE